MLRARAPFLIPLTLLAIALVAPALPAQVKTDNIAERDSTRVGGQEQTEETSIDGEPVHNRVSVLQQDFSF
jgi:hypothetical protein